MSVLFLFFGVLIISGIYIFFIMCFFFSLNCSFSFLLKSRGDFYYFYFWKNKYFKFGCGYENIDKKFFFFCELEVDFFKNLVIRIREYE